MYKIFRDILFLFDPEKVHYFSMKVFKMLAAIPGLQSFLFKQFKAKTLPVKVGGLTFKNPVGLGAGFDKNAVFLDELQLMGFGFVEIGTVTPLSQIGNEKPRLFRLPTDKALINRMGFNNDGAKIIANRLKKWRRKNAINKKNDLVIGGNIGKNKTTPNEDAWLDYEKCFTALHEVVDYFVVNVSSPNTPGLRELQDKDSLEKILTNLQRLNGKYAIQRPVFLKISPDLSLLQLDEIITLVNMINLDGLIIANTTIARETLKTPAQIITDIGAGGLSGKPLHYNCTDMVKYVSEKTNGRITIIASGGIFTAEDARERFSAGALLLQVWTGFIYEGPAIVKNICKGL
ncbi:MAG: quinone-dependent dihydroorotate dehydrogenase [Ferruginibacter sp.]